MPTRRWQLLFFISARTPLAELKQTLASRGHSHEVAVLIPSIDLMGGKIVQLVQGEKKALEFDDFEYWIERFSAFPLVQLIDLDAAMGQRQQSGIDRHDL